MLSRKKTLVLLLALIFLGGAILFGYRHWVDTQQSTDMTVTSSAQPLQNETINGIEVPPEPDPELNNATLAGIDVNSNGVRDDVERWIIVTFPDSAKERSALIQSASSYQRLITNSDSVVDRIEFMNAAIDCMTITFMSTSADVNGGKKAFEIAEDLRTRVYNTKNRIKTYFEVNALFAGTVSKSIPFDQRMHQCAVDPSTLPN